jgi:alanine dehydrogenase
MVRSMKPGSVIVDVAVDQGGCIATTHETTHTDPIYMQHGVVHYAVGNMPGAVPYTSTYSLTNATLPYQLDVARLGALGAATQSEALRHGLNTARGHITNDAVARELKLNFVEPLTALS